MISRDSVLTSEDQSSSTALLWVHDLTLTHQSLLSKRSHSSTCCQEMPALCDGSSSAAHLPVGWSWAWRASSSPTYCHVTHFPSQGLSVLHSSSGLRCVATSLFDLRNVPVYVIGNFALCLLTQINPSLQIERDEAWNLASWLFFISFWRFCALLG